MEVIVTESDQNNTLSAAFESPRRRAHIDIGGKATAGIGVKQLVVKDWWWWGRNCQKYQKCGIVRFGPAAHRTELFAAHIHMTSVSRLGHDYVIELLL
jgi:hypothetical protein